MYPAESVQPPPEELGGYRIVRALKPGASYQAVAPGGRDVVLKMLDRDCLLGNGLHPSIKDRLARLCELAHHGVANLHGVERDGDHVYAVWDYVEGKNFEAFSAPGAATDRQILIAARELVLAIGSLHALGIVHGALHARNVIINAHWAVRLTDVSPLLHHDPAVDEEALVRMLKEIVARRSEERTALGRLLENATSLRQLSAALAAAVEGKDNAASPQDEPVRAAETTVRRRALAGAAAVAGAGILLAAGLHLYGRQFVDPLPEPPQADANALQPATP